jgi:hypothetical protein
MLFGSVGIPNTNPMLGGETPLAYMIRGGLPAMLRVGQLSMRVVVDDSCIRLFHAFSRMIPIA